MKFSLSARFFRQQSEADNSKKNDVKDTRPRYKEHLLRDNNIKVIVVGDIHGRADLLIRLFSILDIFNLLDDKYIIEVYLGDYIDKGPNSRRVIDLLLERKLHQPGKKLVFLSGNHEAALLHGLSNDLAFADWLKMGGLATLRSYGITDHNSSKDSSLRLDFLEALPAEHHLFFSNLRASFVFEDFLFVHAGVRPNVPLEFQRSADLLNIRDEFLSSEVDFGFTVVHGHTISERVVFRNNRIGIDTGAYLTGILSSLVISADGIAVCDTDHGVP